MKPGCRRLTRTPPPAVYSRGGWCRSDHPQMNGWPLARPKFFGILTFPPMWVPHPFRSPRRTATTGKGGRPRSSTIRFCFSDRRRGIRRMARPRPSADELARPGSRPPQSATAEDLGMPPAENYRAQAHNNLMPCLQPLQWPSRRRGFPCPFSPPAVSGMPPIQSASHVPGSKCQVCARSVPLSHPLPPTPQKCPFLAPIPGP